MRQAPLRELGATESTACFGWSWSRPTARSRWTAAHRRPDARQRASRTGSRPPLRRSARRRRASACSRRGGGQRHRKPRERAKRGRGSRRGIPPSTIASCSGLGEVEPLDSPLERLDHRGDRGRPRPRARWRSRPAAAAPVGALAAEVDSAAFMSPGSGCDFTSCRRLRRRDERHSSTGAAAKSPARSPPRGILAWKKRKATSTWRRRSAAIQRRARSSRQPRPHAWSRRTSPCNRTVRRAEPGIFPYERDADVQVAGKETRSGVSAPRRRRGDDRLSRVVGRVQPPRGAAHVAGADLFRPPATRTERSRARAARRALAISAADEVPGTGPRSMRRRAETRRRNRHGSESQVGF